MRGKPYVLLGESAFGNDEILHQADARTGATLPVREALELGLPVPGWRVVTDLGLLLRRTDDWFHGEKSPLLIDPEVRAIFEMGREQGHREASMRRAA